MAQTQSFKLCLSLTFMLTLMIVFSTMHNTNSTGICTFKILQDGLHADCSTRQLKSLPSSWPDDVVWLDMSHNQLSILTNMSHPHLAHLRHLDLSHNQLHHTLTNHTFAPLQQLRWLSLRENQLQGLQANAFKGLERLTFLDLSGNQLQLDHLSYPPGVFDSLTSLQELRLIENDDSWEGEYPDGIFRSLQNLQSLSIDTFSNTQFGYGFAALKNLKVLTLFTATCNAKKKYCNLRLLSNATLEGFQNSSLEEIRIGSYALLEIENCAFCHLPRLKALYFLRANIPVTRALTALYGLQNQNMSVIYLWDFWYFHEYDNTVIDQHNARFLRRICVSKLVMAHSRIRFVTNTALYEAGTPLVECLQDFDVSDNRIRGDRLVFYIVLTHFRNLRSYRLDKQAIYTSDHNCHYQEGEVCKPSSIGGTKLQVSLPQSLQYLNFSWGEHLVGMLPGLIRVVPESHLKVLDFSRVGWNGCHTLVQGLPYLETLVLSGNNCYNVSERIFDPLTSLKRLELSDFSFSLDFFRLRARRLFQNVKLLETLDLSRNSLNLVDPHMLREQRRLKGLNLADNRLQSLSVDLEPHQDLMLLDLSHNMLPTLLPNERQALDTLAASHNLSLRLQGNPLLCACSNLDFVRWLSTTSVHLDGDGSSSINYTCMTETGEVSDTHTVIAQFDFHWRRCVGQTMLGIASATFLLQLLVLVIVYVVSRSWTHLHYVWKVMKRLRLPRREHFRRDAYVGYADADWEFACVTLPACLEDRHGVRLLLRDREELPGSIRAENILQHIDDSWKVLLLVTRAFGMDEWLCGFTVQQAQRSITDTMPDRVIVVFMEDPARLPPMASLERLLRMVPERNVLHVHRDTPVGDPVWDKLARDILRDENQRGNDR